MRLCRTICSASGGNFTIHLWQGTREPLSTGHGILGNKKLNQSNQLPRGCWWRVTTTCNDWFVTLDKNLRSPKWNKQDLILCLGMNLSHCPALTGGRITNRFFMQYLEWIERRCVVSWDFCYLQKPVFFWSVCVGLWAAWLRMRNLKRWWLPFFGP